MKILHSSDWHLGRYLHEHSLLQDQQAFLDFLISHIEAEQYAALIIAGDVYDRAVPAPEAVQLFSSFLGTLNAKCPDLIVCILSGNHDSPGRLGFAAELLRNQNIHIATDPKKVAEPVVIQDADEQIHLYMIPFLFPGEYGFTPEGDRLSHEDSIRQAIDMIRDDIDSRRTQSAPNTEPVRMLGAHVFTTGAGSSDSERIFVGTAGQVSASLFESFDYTALGHLHKPQKISDTIRYSGSPIAYSFSEAADQKQMLAITIDGSAVTDIVAVPVPVFRKMKRFEGAFQELLNGISELKEAYLDITLQDEDVLINPMSRLQEVYPYLLSLRQNQFSFESRGSREGLHSRSGTDLMEDFKAFYSHVYEDDAPDSVIKLIEKEAHSIQGGTE